MNRPKKIMIIGAGALQVPGIIKAKEMGLEVISVDMDPSAPGFQYSDKKFLISTLDIEKCVEIALEVKPDAVITLASDMPMRTVASIGERCNLNTISFETAINATDKGRMRNKLKKSNISMPKYSVVNNFYQYKKTIEKFGEKFIVKPADNSGSRGVSLVEDIKQATIGYFHAKENSRSGDILIEEYMKGPEVSVESLTINGVTQVIAITDKLTTGAPHFIEMGHTIPSQLSEKMQDKIKELTKSAIKSLEIEMGPTHTEIIVTPEGPKIVEIGARLGGDNITTHLVPLAKGINMVESTIRLALGETIMLNNLQNRSSAIRYINAEVGILKNVENVEKVMKKEGVKEIRLFKTVGEEIKSIDNSGDRIGYIITQSDTVEEAVIICEEAIRTIKINTIM